MARKIFLDIETLPPHEDFRAEVLQRVLDEVQQKGEMLNEQELAQQSDERFRLLALQGEYGRILTIGLIIEEDGQVKQQGVLGRDRETRRFHLDEARTLRAFWNKMRSFDQRQDLFVGHNILDFDLPFILKRSIIHHIQPSLALPFRRYQRQPIYDTMWEWGCWRHKVKMHELTLALGLASPKTEEMDGGRVYDAYRQGCHEEIARYCMRDVEAARAAYYRLNFADAPAMTRYELLAPETGSMALAV